MTSENKTSKGAMSPEDMVTAVVLAAVGLPLLLPRVRRAVAEWLLDHDIAAKAGEGLITVPWLEVDLTMRLTLVVILLLVMGAAVMRFMPRRSKSRSDSSGQDNRS